MTDTLSEAGLEAAFRANHHPDAEPSSVELDQLRKSIRAYLAATQAAPVAVVGLEHLGRFGWHPDPAIDFETEVGDIEAEIYHHKVGFENGTLSW